MIQIQISLFSDSGYKPMSTIVTVGSVQEWQDHKEEIKKQAVVSICAKRRMTSRDLRKYGYTTIKCRVYDKEKIAKENAERYEKIKQERGWTRQSGSPSAEGLADGAPTAAKK